MEIKLAGVYHEGVGFTKFLFAVAPDARPGQAGWFFGMFTGGGSLIELRL
ncbi:MAG: hypothetical protein WCL16_13085 [bacterium]